jgi:hypothetical protein
MSNFTIFIVGLVVTLITGMGVLTSQVFIGYNKFKLQDLKEYDTLIETKV